MRERSDARGAMRDGREERGDGEIGYMRDERGEEKGERGTDRWGEVIGEM